MYPFVLVALLLVLVSAVAQQAEEQSNDVIFTIEQRLDDQTFTHRTKIHLVKKADGKQALVYPEKNGIFGGDVDSLRKMLDSNGLYTIRIQSHFGNVSSAPIVSSIPACELQKSGFKEDITVYLNPSQSIVGVAYSTPVSTVSRDCDSSKVKDGAVFQTRIKLGDSVPIQWIPLKAVGARPPGMKDVKLGPEDTSVKPPRKSFLQEYWYIVVIMVLYMFLGNAGPPEKPAAGGAPAAGAPAPAAAAK